MRVPEHHESSFTGRVLTGLRDAFPGRMYVVEELTRECARFQEVCSDYLACGDAIRRFERTGEAARERVRDYSELMAELEQELRAMIESDLVCRSCGKTHRKSGIVD